LIAVFFSTFVFSLDTAVSGVSPEYKEAAQKRQAEIARQVFCSEKAGKEKVVKRDLASFVLGCMDKIKKGRTSDRKVRVFCAISKTCLVPRPPIAVSYRPGLRARVVGRMKMDDLMTPSCRR